MMTVHQFHSGTALGDAITNQMLYLKEELIKLGYAQSSIFAEYISDELSDKVERFEKYKGNKDNILIVHHSMGITPESFKKILSLPDRKILIYHNITPEKFFSDLGIINDIRRGLKQVQEYAHHFDCFIAASNYNRRDLIHMGFENRIDILPVHISLNRFDHVEADRTIIEEYNTTTNILFVGRIVWNKRQVDLIKTFAVYQKCFNHNSRLILVGDNSLQSYVDKVQNLAIRLGIREQVDLPGKVSESKLKAYYQVADAFFCMSEHEGFGVPLLEAMKLDVPVLAFRSSAIPETMDRAGIIANKKDYGLLAAMLDEMTSNAELRDKLLVSQQKRIERLEKQDSLSILSQAIENTCKKTRKKTIQLQGPFETSYSLAIVNRKLAEALDDQGEADISIFCTEGPGDYIPKETDLKDKPHAKALWMKSASISYPDITIRNMYPPRVNDVKGGLNFQAFGWEESIIPQDYINAFNQHLDGIGTTSDYVTEKLIECGIKVPVKTMGNGVELSPSFNQLKAYPLKTKKRFRFLHISSAFPRKGVDVLLEAYFEAFTEEDDVCLVLKTFPNPHNNIGEQLKQLNERFSHAPEIEWINQDLKQGDLESLYKASDCYVSVARGEGFGLPVAEAMLAKIPVIVSPNSGMADFCNEDTALLVGYDMVPAKTHVTTGDALHVSLWAEPRKDELKKQMVYIINNANSKDLQQKIDSAYKLISTQFTWKAVANRWYQFIKDIESQQYLPKIGMVTTWNNKCGIAEYTRMQVEASERLADFRIYPNNGVKLLRQDEDNVERGGWISALEGNMNQLTDRLIHSDREIIHFQFNYGFFSLNNLSESIERLKKADKRIIITLHKTADALLCGKKVSLTSIVSALNSCDGLVVHQEDDIDRLTEFGIKREKLFLIKLGQVYYPYVPIEYAKQQKGLKSSLVIGSYGFLLPHKGIKEIIQAMPSILKEYPDAIYMPICAIHDSSESNQYYIDCQVEIDKLGLQNHVRMETRYLDNDDSIKYLQACDLLCMTYKPSMESASGATRFCLAACRPTITTDQLIFSEFSNFTSQIESVDPTLIAEEVIALNRDNERKERYVAGMKEHIWSSNWYYTALEYKRLYRKILKDGDNWNMKPV